MKARRCVAVVGVVLFSGSMTQASDAVVPPPAVAEESAQNALPKTAMFTSEKATEKLHAALFARAKEAVEAGRDVELAAVQVCSVCGHTVEGDAPDVCPICAAVKGKFAAFA